MLINIWSDLVFVFNTNNIFKILPRGSREKPHAEKLQGIVFLDNFNFAL